MVTTNKNFHSKPLPSVRRQQVTTLLLGGCKFKFNLLLILRHESRVMGNGKQENKSTVSVRVQEKGMWSIYIAQPLTMRVCASSGDILVLKCSILDTKLKEARFPSPP